MRGFVLPKEKLTRQFGFVLLLCLLACGGCAKEKSTAELITDLKSSPDQRDRVKAVRLVPEEPEDAASRVENDRDSKSFYLLELNRCCAQAGWALPFVWLPR